ncbi:hypothetical protein GCM10023158_16620 [Gluconacetobacter tumulicola]
MHCQRAKIVNHHRHVMRQISDAAAMGRTRGAPMTGEIQRDNVIVRCQGLDLTIPICKVEANCVDENDRTTLGRAASYDVQI